MNPRETRALYFKPLVASVLAVTVLLSAPPAARALQFPEDHGAHPKQDPEWWYFSGRLETPEKRSYGFMLVFLRNLRQASMKQPGGNLPEFTAHFLITDDDKKEVRSVTENAGAKDSAAGADEKNLNVWIHDWRAELEGDAVSLKAGNRSLGMELELVPRKPAALHGDRGAVPMGLEKTQTGRYYSLTRLEGHGKIRVDGKEADISKASAWMDHAFDIPRWAETLNIQWNWFGIQLDTDEELMIMLRFLKGEFLPSISFGSFVSGDGAVRALGADSFKVEATKYYTSPATRFTYPASWTIAVPELKIRLQVTPVMENQEFGAATPGNVDIFWEGQCLVEGTKNGNPLKGRAYVEVTNSPESIMNFAATHKSPPAK